MREHPSSSVPPAPRPTIPPKDGLVAFRAALSSGGLDLVQPFSVEALLRASPESVRASLEELAFPLGLVIGNTRRLWRAFRSHLASLGVSDSGELGPDPLDIYVEELIVSAISELETAYGITTRTFFAHDVGGRPPIPIQRICDHSGLARLGPAHLNVHPLHGPWLALRAVVTFDLPLEFGIAFGWDDPTESPCTGCSAPCRKALAGALLGRDEDLPGTPSPPPGLSAKQARWLAIRSVCPVGAESRYTDPQILYHYDKDRAALLR